jgi:diadenosine tetraphosphate (Ap4A) HIT family hydrolase
LHIHIIARKKTDSSWPLSVWVVKGKSYKKIELKDLITKIGKGLKIKR